MLCGKCGSDGAIWAEPVGEGRCGSCLILDIQRGTYWLSNGDDEPEACDHHCANCLDCIDPEQESIYCFGCALCSDCDGIADYCNSCASDRYATISCDSCDENATISLCSDCDAERSQTPPIITTTNENGSIVLDGMEVAW